MITAETIKAARLRLGETQTEFAERFGCNQATIHRWETNGPPANGMASVLLKRIIAELNKRRR